MAGIGDALNRATLSDTPPWKVVVGVLKGVKLATGRLDRRRQRGSHSCG